MKWNDTVNKPALKAFVMGGLGSAKRDEEAVKGCSTEAWIRGYIAALEAVVEQFGLDEDINF